MHNKNVIVVCILLLATLFICSCKKNEGTKEIEFVTNRTDMVLGIPDANGKHDPNTAEFKKLAEKFEKETGIKVVLTSYTDFKNALRRRLASGNYGDVITNDNLPPKTIDSFFRPYGTKEEYKDYLFTNFAVGTKNDNMVYGISPGYYIDGVVYNKEVLKNAGYEKFPETLGELEELFKKVKNNNKIPIIINRGQCWPLRFIEQMSAEISGNPAAYNEMWKSNAPFSPSYPFGHALQIAAQWVDNDWVEPEFIQMWEESKTQLATGKTLMMYLGSWILPQIQARCNAVENANPTNIGYAPFPKLDSQKKHYVLTEPEKPFLISKKTKNYEACKKWVSYLIESGIYERQGALPIIRGKTTGIPQLQTILDGKAQGKYTFIEYPAISANGGEKTLNLLKDINIFSNLKYSGFPIDEAKKSMKDFDDCIKQLNKQFKEAKQSRGY